MMQNRAFSDLLDVAKLKELMERHFALTGLPMALCDCDGISLFSVGSGEHALTPDLTVDLVKDCLNDRSSRLHPTGNGIMEYLGSDGLRAMLAPVRVDEGLTIVMFFGFFIEAEDEALDTGSTQQTRRLISETKSDFQDQKPPVFHLTQVLRIVEMVCDLLAYLIELGHNVRHVSPEIAHKDALEVESQQLAAQYRNLFEKAPVGLYRTTLDGRIIDANPALVEMLRFPDRETLLKRITTEGYRSKAQRIEWQKIMEEHGEYINYETEWQTYDGETIAVLDTARAMRDESGKIAYYDGTVQNISPRRISERQTRDAEERFRSVFNASNDAMLIVSSDGRILDANQAASVLYGMTSDELRKICFHELSSVESTHWDSFFFAEITAIGQHHQEMIHRKNSSESIEVDVTASRMPHHASEQILVTVKDVSERRRIETQIQQSEQLYRAFFNTEACTNLILDRTGRILYANETFLKLVHRSRSEVEGCLLITDIVIEADRSVLQQLLERIAPNTSERLEIRFGTDDELHYMMANTDLLPDASLIIMILIDMTAHREVETALRRSEERYRFFFENIQDVYYESTLDGKLIELSPSVQYMSQYTRSELIGQYISDIYANPDSREKLIAELIKNHFINDYEVLLKDKNGEITPCSVTAKLLFDIDGKPIKLYGTMRNITMRKMHEEALQSTMKELDAIVQNSFVGIVFEINGLIRKVNKRASEIFGYSVNEIIGKRLDDLHLDASFYSNFRTQSATCLLSGRVVHLEFPLKRKDGIILRAQINGKALDPRNASLGVVWIIDDITQRKAEEDALLQSEELFRTISTSALDAIIMMDNSGSVVFWNPAAEGMFGYSEHEIIGKNLHELLAPQRYAQQFKAGFAEFSKTGRGDAIGRILELDAIRKDGTEFPIEIALAALNRNSAWWGVAVVRDITERKNAQKLLIESKEELEKAIHHASGLALEAAHANSAKSDFLANMSHEIRTPMNGIIGMIDLMIETGMSDEQRDYLETMRRSAEAMLHIINDILDFSKIEAGKMRIEREIVDLDVILDEMNDLLAPGAQENGIEYLCSIDPNVPRRVIADAYRIRQILTNYIANAIKFTARNGTVHVNVSCKQEQTSSPVVRFVVRDTGIGISREHIDTLFEPFIQADASTTRRFGGTGLGLAICKRLANLMQGNVGVDSTEGEGSAFWFEVPLMPAEDDERSIRELIRLDLSPFTILLLGLSDELTRWMTRHLIEWHANVKVFDEKTPVSTLNTGEYDVMILEAQAISRFPELKLALQIPKTSGPPVILLQTILDRNADKPIEIQPDSVLSKPVKLAQLSAHLGKSLGLQNFVSSASDFESASDSWMPDARDPMIRILYVEDNLINQNLMVKMVEKLGYQIDVVDNGREALNALNTAEYDIVLMDIQMPEMDGLSATRAIRSLENPAISTVPIIAVTAHALIGDREKCLAAGMTDYIAKPIRMKQFVETLKRHLGPSDRFA